MTLQECYAAMEGDYQDALGRLRSDRLVQKFVLKFLADGSYDLLTQSMEEENYAEALPRLSDGSVTRPEDRYRQLKAAVEAYGAEEALNTQGDANENP